MTRWTTLGLLVVLLVALGVPAAAKPLGRRSVVLHNAVDPTGSETFSSTVIVDGAKEFILVHVILTTLTSTNVITTIYCRASGATTFYTIEAITQTATGDQLRSLTDHCFEMRTGVKTTGDVAGDSVTVRGEWR